MVLFFVAFVCSLLMTFLIIRYQYVHAHLTLDNQFGAIQKSHAHEVPRIGGVAIVFALCMALLFKRLLLNSDVDREVSLLLVLLPAFLFGVLEDMRHPMGVYKRLAATACSGLLGVLLLGASVSHVGVALFDQGLLIPLLATLFTALAVAGLTNACNIIDGMNGLLSGVSLIVLAGLATLSHQLNDPWCQGVSMMLGGAILGFMLFNYPRGLIFLGDGGAYTIGVILAELLIVLVSRHADLSPWCACLMVAYPVVETLASIYRRILIKAHIGHPDRSHLHQLIFHALHHNHATTKSMDVGLNSATSPYLWVLSGVPVMLALMLRGDTFLLQLSFIGFVVLYGFIYYQLRHHSLPEYLKVDGK